MVNFKNGIIFTLALMAIVLLFAVFKARQSSEYDPKELDVFGFIYPDRMGGSLERIPKVFQYYFNKHAGSDQQLSLDELGYFEAAVSEVYADKLSRPKIPPEQQQFVKSRMHELELQRFKNLDGDANGLLSFDEYYGKTLMELKGLDKNGDQILSTEEVLDSPQRKEAVAAMQRAVAASKQLQNAMNDLSTKQGSISRDTRNASKDVLSAE